MKRLVLMAVLAAGGCGGEIDEPIHSIVECRGGERCELGCTGQREEIAGTCTATNPTSGVILCEAGSLMPLVESMGTLGCCFPQDDAFRFFVCDEQP